jgi:transcriptional regulator
MLNAITGFEFTVTAWTLKVKVNQHRPEAREALRLQCSAGGDLAQGLLKWMDE